MTTPQKAQAAQYLEASRVLAEAAQLLGNLPEAAHAYGLARACRMRMVILDATRVVDLPGRPERFTVRQDASTGAVVMQDRSTGEKRGCTVLEFAEAGGVDSAWRKASERA
jgi:hypothetical protein